MKNETENNRGTESERETEEEG